MAINVAAVKDIMRAVRGGPAVIGHGAPVTVQIFPPPWELNALDLVYNALPLSGPLSVEVAWSVLDGGENPLAMEGEGTDGDYLLTDSVPGTAASFLFAPPVLEHTLADPAASPAARIIRATVTLKLGATVVQQPFDLDVNVFVPALQVPTVLALFRLNQYRAWKLYNTPGAIFVAVPHNSAIQGLHSLQVALRQLQSSVLGLTSFVRFATFLLGVQNLYFSVTLPSATIRSANEKDKINELGKFTMIVVKDQFNFWIEGAPAIPGTDEGDDKQWSNRASSAILIAPPPLPGSKAKGALRQRVVRLFNADDCGTGSGYLDMRVGPAMCVLVPVLEDAEASIPAGNSDLVETSTFGNKATSLQFRWDDVQLGTAAASRFSAKGGR